MFIFFLTQRQVQNSRTIYIEDLNGKKNTQIIIFLLLIWRKWLRFFIFKQKFKKIKNFGQKKSLSAVSCLQSFKIWLVSKISEKSKQTKINDVLNRFCYLGKKRSKQNKNCENRSIFHQEMSNTNSCQSKKIEIVTL